MPYRRHKRPTKVPLTRNGTPKTPVKPPAWTRHSRRQKNGMVYRQRLSNGYLAYYAATACNHQGRWYAWRFNNMCATCLANPRRRQIEVPSGNSPQMSDYPPRSIKTAVPFAWTIEWYWKKVVGLDEETKNALLEEHEEVKGRIIATLPAPRLPQVPIADPVTDGCEIGADTDVPLPSDAWPNTLASRGPSRGVTIMSRDQKELAELIRQVEREEEGEEQFSLNLIVHDEPTYTIKTVITKRQRKEQDRTRRRREMKGKAVALEVVAEEEEDDDEAVKQALPYWRCQCWPPCFEKDDVIIDEEDEVSEGWTTASSWEYPDTEEEFVDEGYQSAGSEDEVDEERQGDVDEFASESASESEDGSGEEEEWDTGSYGSGWASGRSRCCGSWGSSIASGSGSWMVE
ncbi:hypothetical protein B0H63DRAFT_215274 [Podospora didyma]|uniref:Uncharacterized protein n=1 Tax=Podospora didyma TaxID=330526 RepID=A0AAE0NHZ1_9PEZI|nr:hypothetical protein B0H63DRAFT_215274 [Podospora didyma]